jgi:hypothetical protein
LQPSRYDLSTSMVEVTEEQRQLLCPSETQGGPENKEPGAYDGANSSCCKQDRVFTVVVDAAALTCDEQSLEQQPLPEPLGLDKRSTLRTVCPYILGKHGKHAMAISLGNLGGRSGWAMCLLWCADEAVSTTPSHCTWATAFGVSFILAGSFSLSPRCVALPLDARYSCYGKISQAEIGEACAQAHTVEDDRLI